jgi:hypothetical protein
MAGVAVASVQLDSEVLAVGSCGLVLALLIVGRIFGHHEITLLVLYVRALGTVVRGTAHASSRHAGPLLATRRDETRVLEKAPAEGDAVILPFPKVIPRRKHAPRKAA